MMRTITAKYAGFCSATGARILAGDVIQWQRGRAVLLKRKAVRVDTLTLFGENGAKEFYRNTRGRCIDAPCCGCCTI
jgi:ribosomal protein L27